ncbi:hypothetical protein D4R51_02960, partial [bacterium]
MENMEQFDPLKRAEEIMSKEQKEESKKRENAFFEERAGEIMSEEQKTESGERETAFFDGLKEKYPNSEAMAIIKARQGGVSEEIIKQYAYDSIEKNLTGGSPRAAFEFMKNMKIGTEEEQKAVGERAFKISLENNPIAAKGIAEELYGEESDEYGRALEEIEKERKEEEAEEKEEARIGVTLSRSATFEDLGNKKFNRDVFETELWDNFDSKVASVVIALLSANSKKSGAVKVLDFFKERGYSEDDISTFLSIKF